VFTLFVGATLALTSQAGAAGVLFDNGPIVTNPTGGTGSIAGQPISQADGFTVPGQSFIFSTTGVGATVSQNTSVADNFVVPAGSGGWDLDSVTLFAFQSGQTTPSVTSIHINLWTAAPYSAGSPGPLPDPLPQPVLAAALVLPAGPGTFVAQRESTTGTSTVRPVFAYTVSLNDLPGGGVLGPGEYWLEWSFDGALSSSPTVFTPLVTPRTSAFDTNARQYNSLDGQATSPRVWFEGREGFVSGVTDGRGFALPFVLQGTALPAPAGAGLLLALGCFSTRRTRHSSN
jgi:hypothetical protein